MIAAISLMRRRPDVPLTMFRRHWLDVHGPLVSRFAGLRHYVQCHVISSPIMSAAAQDMRIDGFPMLFFNRDSDRCAAYGSPEMALCNADSRHFIGAVSRVIADTEDIVPRSTVCSPISMIAMTPPEADEVGSSLRELPRLRGLTRYHIGEQGAAPRSTIPYLPVTVGGIAQAWFDSLVDLEEAMSGWPDPRVELFVVEQHWLLPKTLDVFHGPVA